MSTSHTPRVARAAHPRASQIDGDALLVARQPIFDRRGRVLGFELLYRQAHPAVVFDPQRATASVMLAGLAELGLEPLVDGHVAFINVTRELLLDLDPLPLPPSGVVLELLEDQQIDEQLLETLQKLRESGFHIALDDFVVTEETLQLVEFANIVKLDVQALTSAELADSVKVLRPRNVMLLAEKVETEAEHLACLALGFEAFQGYYFAEPQVMQTAVTPTRNLNAVTELVRAGSSSTFEELEELITKDPGLSHRFLRLSNSAFYPHRSPVSSIHEGLTRLGTVAVRRWAMVMMLSQVVDNPGYLLTLGLQRAHTCELLSDRLRAAAASRCFTVGLLSVLDSLLDQPMEYLLAQLPLDARINRALLSGEGAEGHILASVVAYEHGDFDAGLPYGLHPVDISEAHRRSAHWADVTTGLLT